MHRRDLLRWLGTAAAVPALTGLSPNRLLALALEAHGRVASPAAGRSGNEAGSTAAFRAFDAGQAETVATIAELIIPETDTPGARAAGVAEFIDLIVAERYDADERERFLEGLAGVDARSRTTFGAAFTALSPRERTALLRGLDAEVTALREAAATEPEEVDADVAAVGEAAAGGLEAEGAALQEAAAGEPEDVEAEGVKAEGAAPREAAREPEATDPDDHFFAQMKWLTVFGYYTSEVGVNQELEYVMIPGRFDPCAATGLRPEPGGS